MPRANCTWSLSLGRCWVSGCCAWPGIVIHYSLMFLLASISFWTVRAQGIVWGYYNLFNIARMPDEAFHGCFKALFTFCLPMLLVSNVPVPESLTMCLWTHRG
jgi:ABC-type uncharacterized transport system permease subunit